MSKQFWADACHNLMVTCLIIGMTLCAVDTSDAYSIDLVYFKFVIVIAFVLNVLKYRITPYQKTESNQTNKQRVLNENTN